MPLIVNTHRSATFAVPSCILCRNLEKLRANALKNLHVIGRCTGDAIVWIRIENVLELYGVVPPSPVRQGETSGVQPEETARTLRHVAKHSLLPEPLQGLSVSGHPFDQLH